MELVLIGASNNLKNINYSVFKKLNIKVKYLVSNSLTERTKLFAKKFQTTILNYSDLKKKMTLILLTYLHLKIIVMKLQNI